MNPAKFTFWTTTERFTALSNRSKIPLLALVYILLLAIGAGCFLTVVNPEPPAGVPAVPPSSAVSITEPVFEPTETLTPFVAPSIGVTNEAPTFTPSLTAETSIVFAVIGDFGMRNKPEAEVADLIKSWKPDFILTTGDNNYPNGSSDTIDASIGQYFHNYISPYNGEYGEGADQNRFFPSLGNHDWVTAGANPYLEYFHLEGNERFYEFSWGPVDFFAVDSDSNEPDGVAASSEQARWLKERLEASEAPWKIVYMHHPAYSSGTHGSVTWMRWPFREWGATAVLSGHDHVYERLMIDGLPYFTNGLGGGPIYSFVNILEGSQIRYNADYGAMRVEANSGEMTFQFINRRGEVIDTYGINH